MEYFGVTPTNEEIKYVNSLREIVKEYWNKNRTDKKELSNTFTYKVLFDLIENEENLNFITRGWFKYGAIINFIPDKTERVILKDDLREKIINLCDEYDCNKNYYDWQLKQYTKFKNEFYKAMLNLKINLESDSPSQKEIKSSLIDFYKNLINSEDYVSINELIEKYIILAEQTMIASKDIIKDSKKLLEFFNCVWDCFANFNYAYTVKGNKKEEIKKEALKMYKLSFPNCKKDLIEYMEEEINTNEEVILKVSTPLQRQVITEINSFK